MPNRLAEIGEPRWQPDRAGPQGPQHAEDSGSVRGVPRDCQDQGRQAPEEAPAVPCRRERAAPLLRHDRGVPAGARRLVEPVHVRPVPRVQGRAARLLGEEGIEGRDRGVHDIYEWKSIREHRHGRERPDCEEGLDSVQGDCREGSQAIGEHPRNGRSDWVRFVSW